MKKTILVYLFVFSVSLALAQGDTVSEAEELDGFSVSGDLLGLQTANNSGLMPACANIEDIFFKHTVSSGDNSVTIGMVTAGISILTDFNYQIFVAPGGNLGMLTEISCDSYTVLLAGGNFEYVISDVNENDVYYLRIFEPEGLISALLIPVLNATVVEMTSEFDPSLSVNDSQSEEVKIVVRQNEISLLNDDFLDYSIFSLDGKKLMQNSQLEKIEVIDIQHLQKGIYILLLQDEKKQMNSIKFLKT